MRGTTGALIRGTRKSARAGTARAGGGASVGPLHTCFLVSWYKEFRMKKVLSRMWKEEDGVLSFEWVMLVTLLTIGIVSGLSGARDAIIDELGDVAQAMLALDQSYTIAFPLAVNVHTTNTSSASDSAFTDAALYIDCARTDSPEGQPGQDDLES